MITTARNTTRSTGFASPNHEATKQFASGNYKECLSNIHLALCELRRLVAAKESNPNHTVAAMHADQDSLFKVTTVAIDPFLLSKVPEADTSCGGIGFFDRIFLISRSNSENDDDPLIADNGNETKICVLLLYNMAVAKHLGGLLSGSKEDLSAALNVYRMACDFLQSRQQQQHQGEDEEFIENDPTLQLFGMALMNNVAHIQSCIWFHSAESNQCIEWLRSVTQLMDPQALQDQDFLFFFVHYYVMPSNNPVSSPAA